MLLPCHGSAPQNQPLPRLVSIALDVATCCQSPGFSAAVDFWSSALGIHFCLCVTRACSSGPWSRSRAF